jgi:hypothetical protein
MLTETLLRILFSVTGELIGCRENARELTCHRRLSLLFYRTYTSRDKIPLKIENGGRESTAPRRLEGGGGRVSGRWEETGKRDFYLSPNFSNKAVCPSLGSTVGKREGEDVIEYLLIEVGGADGEQSDLSPTI